MKSLTLNTLCFLIRVCSNIFPPYLNLEYSFYELDTGMSMMMKNMIIINWLCMFVFQFEFIIWFYNSHLFIILIIKTFWLFLSIFVKYLMSVSIKEFIGRFIMVSNCLHHLCTLSSQFFSLFYITNTYLFIDVMLSP